MTNIEDEDWWELRDSEHGPPDRERPTTSDTTPIAPADEAASVAPEVAAAAAASPATPPTLTPELAATEPSASDGATPATTPTPPSASASPAAAPGAAASSGERRPPRNYEPKPRPAPAAPPASAPDDAVVAKFADDFGRLSDNVQLALRGKDDIVRLALVCLFAEGHLLLEDVPGVGKTTLARAMAASLDSTWQRIQFTPDLLPSDVTGVSIYNQANQSFEFHPGPVFANVVIGDEINRASPKTQSSLLEVMEERQVTVEGQARPVARPFMVIATQNPVEMDGTYRLPEAQLDRFLMRTSLGYPDTEAEIEILRGTRRWTAVEQLEPVLSASAVQRMTDVAASVHVSEGILRYVTALAEATRVLEGIRLGVSPRGSLALVRAARALAASEGRPYVTPEDVKDLAAPVLTHRILVTAEAEVQGHTAESVLAHVMDHVPVPVKRS